MGQKINYRLHQNGGSSNEDCLIISIGKTVQPDVDDDMAKNKGWSIIEEGISSMDVGDLQALYLSLKYTYEEEIAYNLADQAPEDETELKNQCRGFISKLKSSENIKKGIELLACLSNDYKKQYNINIVDKDRLEQNAGSVYAEFKGSISQNKTLPQYIVSNGGHFSNVVPETEAIGFDSDINIKDSFIQMMSTQMSEATSFAHPKYREKLISMDDDIPNAYDSDMLKDDIVNHIRSKTKNILEGIETDRRDNPELYDNPDNRKIFEQNRSDSLESIRQVYSLINDLPSQSIDELSLLINKLKGAQIKLDEVLCRKMEYEEKNDTNTSTKFYDHKSPSAHNVSTSQNAKIKSDEELGLKMQHEGHSKTNIFQRLLGCCSSSNKEDMSRGLGS
jgi:hypothetical protein